MTTIVIGGDIYPAGNVKKAFTEGNASEIFHDLQEEIASADLSIANLECPLISQDTPIAKAGPVMGAHTSCVNGFVAAGWDVLNLANNHSFDHGASGLRETIRTIEDAGREYIGAGDDLREAQTPLVTEINGERIVVYSMAEHEFSVADEKTPGANPLDLVDLVYAIRRHKQQGLFIVLIHGGNEHYPYPSPEMVKRCRFMVDMGADAVICCHTHCPLPWEYYADRPIVYGLGNLIFESASQEPNPWYEGYLAKLTVENSKVRFEAIPYVQSKARSGAQRMSKDEGEAFLSEMKRKSDQLGDSAFLSAHWVKHCRQKEDTYLGMLFGHSRLTRKLRKYLPRTWHSEERARQALLLVRCEAHQEVLNTIFNLARHKE